MQKRSWKKRIEGACREAGTYQPFFDSIIDTLAGVLETRDSAEARFKKGGGKPVIKYKNTAGATNVVKNPELLIVLDMNAQALTMWKELGLTPAGLRKINEAAMKEQKRSALAEALEELGS